MVLILKLNKGNANTATLPLLKKKPPCLQGCRSEFASPGSWWHRIASIANKHYGLVGQLLEPRWSDEVMFVNRNNWQE
jgi:hypothetical protein